MAARITREFLDRMRDDPDFLEATPGDASEAVAIIDLAISALSHPAALERARAEERERCAKIAADRIMAARLGDLDADLRSIAGSIDHDIRALSALSPQTDVGAG